MSRTRASFLIPTLGKLALAGLWLTLAAGGVGAQQGGAAPATVAPADTLPPTDSLSVFLVTFGPGSQVWERFGHNAIWIHDPEGQSDFAYNWGMFSFTQEGYLGRLLRGTMMYWMAPIPMQRMADAYYAMDRTIVTQQLALTREQALEIKNALEVNALPDNMYYRYDYYRDNCSTRVRDALDRVTGGRLRATLEGVPTGTSYRYHTRRLLQSMPSMYTGIQIVLSSKADREIDRWEEAFLPIKLMEEVRDVRVPDGAGGEKPLVASEREIYTSQTLSEEADVSSHLLWYLVPGVVLAVLLLLLARPEGWARAPLALLVAAWSFAAGLGGLVLLGAWMFTDHVFWYPNANLLQLDPLSLVLGVLALALLARSAPSRAVIRVAAIVAGLSFLGLLCRLVLAQQNGEILAFTVPVNLGVLGALLRLRSITRSPEPA